MANKKKKVRLRYGRIAAALCVLAAIVVLIYYIIVGGIALFNWIFRSSEDTEKNGKKPKVEVTPEMRACDEAMARRLDSLMNLPQTLDTSLIAVSVYDVTTESQVYEFHADKSMAPASCMKIATAVAALKTLGMNYHYNVSLQVRGEMDHGTLVGHLLLVADDDPLFTDFTPLVRKLKEKGISKIRGNIYLNLAREDTLKAHPTGKTWDIPYHKAPLLMKGKDRITRQFMATLSACGVSFEKDLSVNSANAKGKYGGGRYHYVVLSRHDIKEIITPMLIHSSNVKADALFYHLDWKKGILPEKEMVWDRKHYTEIFWNSILSPEDSTKCEYPRKAKPFLAYKDGSGLSPENLLTANTLVDMLRYTWDDKELRDYFIKEALASPGGERSGSLKTRMARAEYINRIFVKTGTLVTKGGSSLSGYLQGLDGHWYIFSIIHEDSPVADARIFQDRLCKMMMGKRAKVDSIKGKE
ncbi:MAG: D-alanyl-D-alanine carboxypeptidase [Prevotellaceae bacterium]|nr:D-alanyl-D-alanine carboxypeptidase [Prevotellaceae bacterium]